MPNIVGDIVGFAEQAHPKYSFIIINEAGTDEVLTLYIPRDRLDKDIITLAFFKQRDLFFTTDLNGVVTMMCFVDENGGLFNDSQ